MQLVKDPAFMAEPTDEELISLFRQSADKNKAFSVLMNRYSQKVYWHIRRLVVSHQDAEDLLQETFISVYNHLHAFAGESKLYTWLYRIATNECLKLLRNRQKFLSAGAELSEHLIGQIPASSSAGAKEILQTFQAAILRLPEKQRLVFTLRYYDELSYQEISEVLNSSVSSLKTNYHLASAKVKDYLKTH